MSDILLIFSLPAKINRQTGHNLPIHPKPQPSRQKRNVRKSRQRGAEPPSQVQNS
jgi:hypothetical protein